MYFHPSGEILLEQMFWSVQIFPFRSCHTRCRHRPSAVLTSGIFDLVAMSIKNFGRLPLLAFAEVKEREPVKHLLLGFVKALHSRHGLLRIRGVRETIILEMQCHSHPLATISDTQWSQPSNKTPPARMIG